MSTAVNPDTLVQLALQDLQINQLAAAEAKCLSALGADREHALGWTVLGMILQTRGRHDDAIRVFNSLALKQPDVADHWVNLGIAFRGAKRYDESLAAYQRALPLAPPSAQMLYNIGLVHAERLDYESAFTILGQASVMAPADAWIKYAFAQCCYDMGDSEKALEALENWPSFSGLTPANMAEIAHLLIIMGHTRRAARAIDWLWANPPDGGRPSLTLVSVYERINRLADARATMARVKAGKGIDSRDPDLLLAEAVLVQREKRHDEASRLLSLALEVEKDLVRRHGFLFRLAASLHALQDYAGAFAALVEAHRSQVAYLETALGRTPESESATLALTRRGIDPKDLVLWDESDAPSREDSPIFVVGFPRSGTTLLEQCLDAHPGLVSMDEQPFLRLATDQVQSFELQYPAELGRLTAEQRHTIRARYWARVADRVTLRPGQRLVDKNPLNLLRLPLIRRLFPNAQTVLVIRHPCDVLLSCYAQHFRAPDLALLCRDLPALAAGYADVFEFWYQQLALARVMAYELRYEQFVGDFPAEARKLTEFLELPWDAAMLDPAAHARAKGFISTPSYTQVVEPVGSSAVGRWRNYEREIKDILPLLDPQIRRWGYSI